MSFPIILGTEPVARYFLDNDLTDEIGGTNVAAIGGSLEYISGPKNQAAKGTFLNIPHNATLNGYISFWFNTEGQIANYYVFGQSGNYVNTVGLVLKQSGADWYLELRAHKSNNVNDFANSGTIQLNEWYHIVVRWELGYTDLWINNILQCSLSPASWWPNNQSVQLVGTLHIAAFDDIVLGDEFPSAGLIAYLKNNPQGTDFEVQSKVEPNVAVKLTSWTGAEVVTYYSNTARNAVTNVKVTESQRHGIEEFSFELSNDILDPLFTNMVCNIYVDGVWKAGGYTEVIPGIDSFQDKLTITGKGWAHKLKTVVINESYVDDSLDTIVKHVASTYLGADLGIIYNVANISVPVINNLYLDFNDKTLWDVFDTLLDIANFDYPNTNYRALAWLETQQFYFNTITDTVAAKWFEGYQYHNPKVETISDKLVNKVLTYRTTSADDKVTEYVNTFSNAESISNYGEQTKKITASDYYIENGLSKIADSIINRYKDPLTRVTIENIDLDEVIIWKSIVKLASFRRTFFKTINQMESLTGWDVTNLLNTVASISTDQVYTNRTSIKLVSSVGSANDEMVYTLPEIIYSPTNFRIFAYKEELGSEYTVILTDSFANEISVVIGGNNEPIDEWIQYNILINLEVGVETLAADENITTEDDLYVDKDVSTEDVIGVDYLIRDGILNIATVKIVVDSNIVATTYFDEMSVEASVPVEHTLWFEGAEYNYSASRTAKVIFGDTQDSLIDEVKKSVKHGNTAFDVYSKT